jgi:hypothetical protein
MGSIRSEATSQHRHWSKCDLLFLLVFRIRRNAHPYSFQVAVAPTCPVRWPRSRVSSSKLLSDGIGRTAAPSSVNHAPRRFLEQWAASQRARDAKRQASFYANEVRPYLALREASRDAVYEDKRKTIGQRKGLWTFKIEDVILMTRLLTEGV